MLRKENARAQIDHRQNVKRKICQFVVGFSALVTLGSLMQCESALAAGSTARRPGSVAGVVRDAAGTPQIGIIVELLRRDSTLAARVFTDRKGSYSIASVLPGQYALKAMGATFIPTLKQNLHIQSNTVVDLTLNSLYDLMQLAPQPSRTRLENQDDWAWTLRSAQSRPLLRWLDDGSPILVWDGEAETRRGHSAARRARLVATAGDGRFGNAAERLSLSMVLDASALRHMAMSAELAPRNAGAIDAMLGFRQEMAGSGLGSSSVQTLAAVMMNPAVGAGGQQGLQAVSLRSWETLQLLETLEAEAGSDQVLARVGNGREVIAALPFASLTLHRGQNALEYRVATARSADAGADDVMPQAWLPMLGERDGQLRLEHGVHQELGWLADAGPAELQLVLYGDTIENPVLEGAGRLSADEDSAGWMLADRTNGLLRTAGPGYSTAGMLASFESRLPGHNRVKLSYASGDALVIGASQRPESVAVILKGVHPHHAQMYSIALSGTADGVGTRWRASYRSQPVGTVTEVAPFAVDASEPYLNVYIRQPIRLNRQGPGGVEAQLDVRNLLAEGYQPFITSDGSRLYFAQAQRCVRGGLAFTF